MSIHEIVLPETKPETEWILGRAVRKVSPRTTHSLVQSALVIALSAWARERGWTGAEWRFRVAPPGQIRRPLVPDVAYVGAERMRALEGDDFESPPFAPDVAMEVLSPGDRRRYIEHKIGVYLAAGGLLVIVVDPERRMATLHDANGARTVHEDEMLAHPALPRFSLSLRELFAAAEPPR